MGFAAVSPLHRDASASLDAGATPPIAQLALGRQPRGCWRVPRGISERDQVGTKLRSNEAHRSTTISCGPHRNIAGDSRFQSPPTTCNHPFEAP